MMRWAAWKKLLYRASIFLVALVPAFLMALYYDNDFPVITHRLNLLQKFLAFLFLGKWAILLGAVSYLLCHYFIGSPFTLRRHFALMMVTFFLAWVSPVTMFDVWWYGGPGAVMYVYPTLYGFIREEFALCSLFFYGFYCLGFVLFPDAGQQANASAADTVVTEDRITGG